MVVGVLGVVLLLASLVFGDLLDGLVDSADLGGGILSTEVIGAFLAAFGLGAALLSAGLSASTGAALTGGVAAGLVTGAIAALISRSFLNMPTDATPAARHLDGRVARVVTRIPADGLGEVALTVGGHRMKLSARADGPIAAGSDVVIVAVTSPTSVVVSHLDI